MLKCLEFAKGIRGSRVNARHNSFNFRRTSTWLARHGIWCGNAERRAREHVKFSMLDAGVAFSARSNTLLASCLKSRKIRRANTDLQELAEV